MDNFRLISDKTRKKPWATSFRPVMCISDDITGNTSTARLLPAAWIDYSSVACYTEALCFPLTFPLSDSGGGLQVRSKVTAWTFSLEIQIQSAAQWHLSRIYEFMRDQSKGQLHGSLKHRSALLLFLIRTSCKHVALQVVLLSTVAENWAVLWENNFHVTKVLIILNTNKLNLIYSGCLAYLCRSLHCTEALYFHVKYIVRSAASQNCVKIIKLHIETLKLSSDNKMD